MIIVSSAWYKAALTVCLLLNGFEFLALYREDIAIQLGQVLYVPVNSLNVEMLGGMLAIAASVLVLISLLKDIRRGQAGV